MRVTKPWQASYASSISLNKGERMHLTGRQERWQGHLWLWAANTAGTEGWVPDNLVRECSGNMNARRDYSAQELDCALGETLMVHETTHGWGWCENQRAARGWVPLSCLGKL